MAYNDEHKQYVVCRRPKLHSYYTSLNIKHSLKDKYPNFEVGLKCILMVNPYLLLSSYINQKAM